MDQDSLFQALLQLQGTNDGHKVEIRQNPIELGDRLGNSNNQLPQEQFIQRPTENIPSQTANLENKVRSAMLQIFSENPELGAAFEKFVVNPSPADESKTKKDNLVYNDLTENI